MSIGYEAQALAELDRRDRADRDEARAAIAARHPDMEICSISLDTQLAVIRPAESFEVDGVWYHPPQNRGGLRSPGVLFTIKRDTVCMRYRWSPERGPHL